MSTIKKAAKIMVISLLVILAFKLINLYENREWRESYEAYIVPTEYESLKIYCIIDVIQNPRRTLISELHFPFGHSQFCDSSYRSDDDYYDWKRCDNYVNIHSDYDTYEVQVVLDNIATQESYEELDSLYERGIGEAYASKNSDVFHIRFSKSDCPHGKTIEGKNKIYFYDHRDAEIMGFRICSWCQNNL